MIRITSWWLIKLLIKLKFPEVRQLSTAELNIWLADENRSKPLLLDARTSEEYQVSHLDNAKLADEDLQAVAGIDHTTPIVAYCSVGYRSSAIARRLQGLGYQNVFNLEGSIFKWVNENRPIYVGGKQTTKVHPYQRFWQYLLVEPHTRSQVI